MGVDPKSSLTHYMTTSGLIESARSAFEDLKQKESGNLHSWLDLMRTCRQPQILWNVDYLEPKEELQEINDMIREAEDIIYEAPDSISFKWAKFSAEPVHQAAYNTIRMHLKAEDGKIDEALSILQQTEDILYEHLTDIRKSNLLFHACLVYLCCREFGKSHDRFDKHWALTKYADPSQRISLGLNDNQSLLQMVYWFFLKHSEEFQDFYIVRNDVRLADVWNHKKISLLYFMEYDCAWAASLCGLPFYNHARKWASSLPEYERKRSTPVNLDRIWMDEDAESFATDEECTGQERVYFELYNREIDALTTTDPDKADDYLHSYYHYQVNYAEMTNAKWRLINFMKEEVDLDTFDSVVDIGPGCVETPVLSQRSTYHAVDISEKSCEKLRERGIIVEHKPASIFMSKTTNEYDLCFACDVLQHLNMTRLEMFLKNCKDKCKYIAAVMSTGDNVKSDILANNQQIKSVNLHRTVQSDEAWIDTFARHFSIVKTMSYGGLIYVLGKSG